MKTESVKLVTSLAVEDFSVDDDRRDQRVRGARSHQEQELHSHHEA